MDGKLGALGEALGASLNGKKLFRVRCQRAEDRVKEQAGKLENPWESQRSANVAAHSIESASARAVQFFNQQEGVNDYEACDIHAKDGIFIE